MAMIEQKNPRELHIGFIGVGVMGRPMVSNLLHAGFPCTIYDINPSPIRALVAEGATSANSAAEVAQHSDIFITMVVNDAQFTATLFEPGNAASALKPGAIVHRVLRDLQAAQKFERAGFSSLHFQRQERAGIVGLHVAKTVISSGSVNSDG